MPKPVQTYREYIAALSDAELLDQSGSLRLGMRDALREALDRLSHQRERLAEATGRVEALLKERDLLASDLDQSRALSNQRLRDQRIAEKQRNDLRIAVRTARAALETSPEPSIGFNPDDSTRET